MALTPRVIYTCPDCGHEVPWQWESQKGEKRQSKYDLDAIEALLAKGVHRKIIREKFGLTNNQMSGIYNRYWAKVRYWSHRQESDK